MIDSEVARLRRLRVEALQVREIARGFTCAAWATDDSLLWRGACASWRIARVVSGRLKAHPYLRYQKDVGMSSLVRHRLVASYLALARDNPVKGFREYESRLRTLARHLDDTRALSWSSDFSDALGRSQYELGSILQDLAQITQTAAPTLSKRVPRTESLVGELARPIEGDWPYLAF